MYNNNNETSSEKQEVHWFLASTTIDRKGKAKAKEINVNLKQLEKFYAQKYEDIHLDQQQFDKPMGSVHHDSWEKPFQQQDWESEDERKYTYEQESWGELKKENRNEM